MVLPRRSGESNMSTRDKTDSNLENLQINRTNFKENINF